ncbi:MAG: preprotein translocase subunit SecG, partial [Bacteroidales bacterium]|nr:preprotein translocase subunit SecG [Bacteroidales bacterium]
MTSIFVSIIVILSVLMVVLVLIQKSKGGGLAAGF